MNQIKNLPRPVLLVVIIAPFIFWFVPLVTGQAIYWGTPALQFIPWRILGLEQISQGFIPLWNSANGLGAPLLANYQTAFFYPPGWIINILGWLFGNGGTAWGFTFMLALHGSWAGLGMACLAQKYTKRYEGIIISAFAYSLGSFFIARAGFFPMVWTGAWFPWMLVCIPSDLAASRFVWKPHSFPFASLMIVSMTLFAGHAQFCWYMLLFTGVWVAATTMFEKRWKALWKHISGYFCIVVFAAMLSAIQLFPTAELLLASQRSSAVPFETGLAYSYWPWRLITLFAPDFFGNPTLGSYTGFGSYWEDAGYVGIIPLFLAFSTIGMVLNRPFTDKDPAIRQSIILLWVMVIIGFVFALGKNTPVFVFLYRYIPTFDMFNSPARFLIWANISLCLLAAIGSSRWITPSGKGLYWLRLGTAGSLSIVITSFFLRAFTQGIGQHLFRAAMIFGILSALMGGMTLVRGYAEKRQFQPFWMGGIILIVLVDIIVAGCGLNPTLPAGEYEKNSGKMVVISKDGRIYLDPDDEYTLKFSKFNRLNDYRPLNSPEEMLHGILPNTNLLVSEQMVNNFDPLLVASFSELIEALPVMDEQEKLNWLKLMDVRWVAELDLTEESGVSFSEVDGYSRLWWFPCNENAGSHAEALDLSRKVLAEWDGLAAMGVVITEGTEAHECVEKPDSGSFDFQITSETPSGISMQVSSGQDGWVMFSDTWYPGWKASVDGKEVEIVRGFSHFRTVWLPVGDHTIEMRYRPLSFTIGASISLACWIALLILSANLYIGKRKTNRSVKNTHPRQ